MLIVPDVVCSIMVAPDARRDLPGASPAIMGDGLAHVYRRLASM
jgi:hypothetical protein